MTSTLLHEYAHRGAATALFSNRAPEILLTGPAGTGKSRACLEKLYVAALKYPGMRGLIVRKTLVSLASSALVTWTKYVAKESIAAKQVVWYGGSQQESAGYRFTNGSFVAVGGMDKPSKIMSTEYDLVYVQEAIELTEEDWEAITTRLRNGVLGGPDKANVYQQLIADTNPSTPTHWLKQRVNRGVTMDLPSRWQDNPFIYADDGTVTTEGESYLAKLNNLTGVRLQRLRDGLWVAAEGIIYDGWDERLHVVDPFFPPKDWPRYWSIDFGYTNPFVCQRWAEDPDGRLWLYGEIYKTGTLVEDHAQALKKILEREPRPRRVVCDHDAEGRATLERHLGMSTVAAIKNVTAGIQAVAERMRPAGDARARLLLCRGSTGRQRDQALVDARKPTSTLEEIPGYVWSDKTAKEEPLKIDDHGCDAMRYMVADRDLAAKPNIRFLGAPRRPTQPPEPTPRPASGERVIVVGGPRRGKSTLAAEYLARGVPVYCGDPRSKVKDPMEGVTYLPEQIPFAGDDGAAQWIATHWFALPGSWVCEGHVMARALRRWAASNRAAGSFPCDRIVVLDEARAPTSAGQETMHKGVMTVWREIRPRFAGLVGEPVAAAAAPRYFR